MNKYIRDRIVFMKKLTKTLVYSIIVGFVLTLISLASTVDISFEANLGEGTYRGFPFTWFHTSGIRTDNPITFATSEILWGGFVLDFVFWLVVSFVILFFYFKKKK